MQSSVSADELFSVAGETWTRAQTASTTIKGRVKVNRASLRKFVAYEVFIQTNRAVVRVLEMVRVNF